jgi:hypothetical protein
MAFWICAAFDQTVNAIAGHHNSPQVDKLSGLYTLRTTHTMSTTRSIVPRMLPPMYIGFLR